MKHRQGKQLAKAIRSTPRTARRGAEERERRGSGNRVEQNPGFRGSEARKLRAARGEEDFGAYRRPGACGRRPTPSPTAARSSPPPSRRKASSRTEPSPRIQLLALACAIPARLRAAAVEEEGKGVGILIVSAVARRGMESEESYEAHPRLPGGVRPVGQPAKPQAVVKLEPAGQQRCGRK